MNLVWNLEKTYGNLNSLTEDETYVTKMKEHIKHTKDVIDKSFSDSSQTKWEFLKYEMRKFTISYSKVKAKNSREKRAHLENKLKSFRTKPYLRTI